MASISQRMIGAARLSAQTFEEVEHDTTATGQAMLVVLISSLAAGIGAASFFGLQGLIVSSLAALLGWFLWAVIIFIVGTKLLPQPQTRSNLGELLRTIGFASSPGVLRIFGFTPFLGWLITLLASIWMLLAMVIAVRQALDYRSTGRAVGVCVIGWVVHLVVYGVCKAFLGLYA